MLLKFVASIILSPKEKKRKNFQKPRATLLHLFLSKIKMCPSLKFIDILQLQNSADTLLSKDGNCFYKSFCTLEYVHLKEQVLHSAIIFNGQRLNEKQVKCFYSVKGIDFDRSIKS